MTAVVFSLIQKFSDTRQAAFHSFHRLCSARCCRRLYPLFLPKGPVLIRADTGAHTFFPHRLHMPARFPSGKADHHSFSPAVLRLKACQQARARGNYYDYSNFRGLVILVEYNDRSFESSDYSSIINDMVNKPNYEGYDPSSEYGRYTGSVRARIAITVSTPKLASPVNNPASWKTINAIT